MPKALDELTVTIRENELFSDGVKRGARTFYEKFRRWPHLACTHVAHTGQQPVHVEGNAWKRFVRVEVSERIGDPKTLVLQG